MICTQVKPVNENKRARNIISALVDAAPELASAVDEHNHTPLDVAVANRKWMAVERLVEAAPACVKRSDAAPLPLYASALAGAAPPRVLRCLEEAHPRSDMPLPSLVKCKFYDDALRAVTEEAAKRKDDRDRLPLHLVAADPDAPEALIAALAFFGVVATKVPAQTASRSKSASQAQIRPQDRPLSLSTAVTLQSSPYLGVISMRWRYSDW